MSDLLDADWLESARVDANDGKRFRSDEVLAMLDHIEAQAACIADLESELATLRASVVAALSSAGPEVGEDDRAP